MKKLVKYYPISHGHIIATWHILLIAKLYNRIIIKNVISIVEKSGKLGGTVPANQGLKICFDYGLLRIKDDELIITDIAEEHIISKCDTEDPNIDVQRALLLHLMSYHNFEWLIFYDSDPVIFRDHLLANDIEWTNMLDNAELFNFNEEAVNVWWNTVLSKYEDYKEERKKAIGDIGEKLTYQLELQRIATDGFSPPKSFVKWASRISNNFGFDIQSIRGKHFISCFKEKDKINIEVKSSESDNIERFRFYISKSEWNTALNNLNSYYFFCWLGINLNTETAKYGPFIIPATDLIGHIPTDNSEYCQWTECRCVIDIIKYEKLVIQ